MKNDLLKVDSREPPKILRLLERNGIKHTVESLPVGDFVYKDVVIERKTTPDLIQSMRQGHLQKQLLQMQDNYDKCFLIIVGSFKQVAFNQYIRNWTVTHHLGMLASLATRYPKVKTVQVDNDTQLIKLIPKICEKACDGKVIGVEHTELMRDKYKDAETTKLRMLLAIPGLGYSRALPLSKIIDVKIINKKGDPITHDELCVVDGVGKKTIHSIMELNE